MGIFEQVVRGPEKMIIAKPDDPRRSIEAQFNPTDFTESLVVNYSRQKVPGLSHEVLQYVNTSNLSFNLELFFDARKAVRSSVEGTVTGGAAPGAPKTGPSEDEVNRILEARRFLHSVAYPRRVPQLVVGGGPPRLLFLWPGIIALTTVLTSLSIALEQFAPSGHPIQFRATVTLEEIRDFRLLTDDVFELGTIRGPDAPGGTNTPDR